MSVVVLQVASWSRLTSNPTVPADYSNRTTHTVLRPARAESLHVAEGHRSSLFEEGHNQQERHHIEELAEDSLAADHDPSAPQQQSQGYPPQDPNRPYDPNAPEGERGLGGAIAGGLAGHFAGNRVGNHGFLGTIAGAIAGSKLQDKYKDKPHHGKHHGSSHGSSHGGSHGGSQWGGSGWGGKW